MKKSFFESHKKKKAEANYLKEKDDEMRVAEFEDAKRKSDRYRAYLEKWRKKRLDERKRQEEMQRRRREEEQRLKEVQSLLNCPLIGLIFGKVRHNASGLQVQRKQEEQQREAQERHR